jgi:hypothetical protein
MIVQDVIVEIASYIGGNSFAIELRRHLQKYNDTGRALEVLKLEIIRRNAEVISLRKEYEQLWKERFPQGELKFKRRE